LLGECSACLRRWADEIRNRKSAGLDHLIAEPTHAASLLDAIGLVEAEILVDVGAYFVGVEMHRIEPRRQKFGQRRLACARQAHDQDFAGSHGGIPHYLHIPPTAKCVAREHVSSITARWPRGLGKGVTAN